MNRPDSPRRRIIRNGACYRGRVHHPHPVMGIIADALTATLADLRASDARILASISRARRHADAVIASLDADCNPIADAIALLESHGYTVTR